MLLFVGVASVCSLLAFSARAQGNIKGTITDEKNQPVFGATVQIVGSSQGAATDATGGFLIEGVPDGDRQIQISFIGYTDKVVPVKVVKGQTTQTDAQLGENSEIIDEVVVVGYGTQQKRDVTGAIAKVEGKTITGLQTSSFEQGLQGNASGVQVVQGSGVVGSASVVRIRGNGSISAGGDPLYVVDGIPISQSYFLSGGSNGGTNNNPLSSLNPNDIESVEVLKDAAATAIFGSRGGNGVIIITTKRGKDKSGKPQFTFGVRAGWSEPTKTLDFLSSEEYAQLRQRAWELDGNTGIAPLHPTLAATGYSRNELEHMNHDWMKDVLRTGYKQEYNLGMSLGTEKVKTYIGASYSDNKGYIIDNGQTRASLRANVDWQATKKFKVSVSTSLSQTLLNKANLLNKG